MLPTPENFHYMYNLRDLSRITEGLLLAEADVVTNAKLLFQLFKHEADRVLCDKLSLKRHKNDYSVALEVPTVHYLSFSFFSPPFFSLEFEDANIGGRSSRLMWL